jgi:hypothetical protein
MYPDWWGHEEYQKENIKTNDNIPKDCTIASGLPTPKDPPPRVLSYSCIRY